MSNGYELNEKDIDKTLNYLRIFHPDRATPELAIEILETMFIKAHHKGSHGEDVSWEEAVEQVLNEMDSGKSKQSSGN